MRGTEEPVLPAKFIWAVRLATPRGPSLEYLQQLRETAVVLVADEALAIRIHPLRILGAQSVMDLPLQILIPIFLGHRAGLFFGKWRSPTSGSLASHGRHQRRPQDCKAHSALAASRCVLAIMAW
jgi:hypothetical protein